MKLILSKSETSRMPLWLSFSCNELKIFGEFTTITDKIAKLPDNLVDLIKQIINRVNSEFEDDIILEVYRFILFDDSNFSNNIFITSFVNEDIVSHHGVTKRYS
jgi:hypothetical protein